MTEKKMLIALYKDSEAGMQLIYDQYVALVYKIVLQKTRDVCTKEDIEEIVSDVFVDFYYHFRNIDMNIGSLTAFIITISQRKAIDSYRKKTRCHIQALSSDDENTKEIAANFSLEEKILDKFERDFLFDKVMSLGEPNSTIVVRKFLLGENCKEIGGHLNMSSNAVIKRLNRSLEKLRLIMEGAKNNE